MSAAAENPLSALYQNAFNTVLRALVAHDVDNWSKPFTGVAVWPCEICLELHILDTDPEPIHCNDCGRTKCATMFYADRNGLPVDSSWCEDCKAAEDICVCCHMAQNRQCAGCGEVCCRHYQDKFHAEC